MITVNINVPTKEELYDMYITKQMSVYEISKFCKTDEKFIKIFLRDYKFFKNNKIIKQDFIINDKINMHKKQLRKQLEIIKTRKNNLVFKQVNTLNYELFKINQYKNRINTPRNRYLEINYSKNNLCYRCSLPKNGSMHHIIPRKFGGGNHKENLVFLCFDCHNYVEIKTDELLTKHDIYDTNILKSYIISNFPE